jgi:hypothetical protein
MQVDKDLRAPEAESTSLGLIESGASHRKMRIKVSVLRPVFLGVAPLSLLLRYLCRTGLPFPDRLPVTEVSNIAERN